MNKIAIKVNCILSWNNEYARMLIMQTEDNKISFPIIIADSEASSLLKELEHLEIKRPQTHDLFYSFMQSFDICIDEVYIHNVMEGIFYTKLICSFGGKTVELDSRPSDAIILALKTNAPIFAEKSILDKLGIATVEMEKQIMHSENNENVVSSEENVYEKMLDEDLENILQQSIEMEDFETASQIRDILKKRGD